MSKGRAVSPEPSDRISDEDLKYLRELGECNDSKCRYYLNKIKSYIAKSASSMASSMGSSMRNSAYTAALALAKRTAPHDVTPVTPATSVTPKQKIPLPLVRMYAQPSEYDVKMSDLQQDLANIREKLETEKFKLARNLEYGSNPGRPGIIDADTLSTNITSGRANVEKLKQQELRIMEQISKHATMNRGGKSKQSKRSKQSKQSKQSKRVSSKRGLTKRRKH
jgi:hypothetical protein